MTANQPDQQFSAGTVEHGARYIGLHTAGEFTGEGKKSGHGTVAWLAAPAYEMPQRPWQPDQPPVIALLDSGVQPHDWLPEGGDPPFVVDATQYGWPAPELHQPAPPPGESAPYYGSHYGHATFIAGLIRLEAPGAQVLSMQVMNNAGKVSQPDVVDALAWLADHAHDVPVDIVLMCFGRQADPDDPDLDDLRKAMTGLGKRVVASAGNDSSDQTVFPAAFAVEKNLRVVSVGAYATPTERAPYSNYGPWVREWRRGTNLVSTMPLTTRLIGEKRVTDQAGAGTPDVSATGNGFAWWSGTSFAAAVCAGELAERIPAA